ncbi:MAG: PilZ domain-containing protein [Phycisphaerales bacterium]|nr:PilZ domain-containing protein [Phycisphaerales bacterium]
MDDNTVNVPETDTERSADNANRRAADRFAPRVGYSRVVIVPDGVEPNPNADKESADSPFEGHAYDVSLNGLRFELDEPLEEGTKVDVELHLPGLLRSIRTKGRIVRVFDEDGDQGPKRMAVTFQSFENPVDASRLTTHLGSGFFGHER